MSTAAVKAVVRGRFGDTEEWRNVFYWTTDSDWSETSVQTFIDSFYGDMSGYICTPVTIYAVDMSAHITSMLDTDPESWTAAETIPVTFTGTASGQALPPADAYLILAKTNVKHVLGRKYIPGVSENLQSSGVIDPTAKSGIETVISGWYQGSFSAVLGTATACTWGVGHGFVPITSARVSNYIFHLNRRQPGRGI